MTEPIAIRELRADERGWANERYAAIQFATTPAHAAALVAELDGARVGLGRLVCHAPQVVELGGIWTADAMRGRGVARAMVGALLERLARDRHAGPVWCIPFAHLVAFYASFGFAPVARPWPPAIAAKVANIAAHGLPASAVLARPGSRIP
jgi:GNAT superfamily N-acetyltransferase